MNVHLTKDIWCDNHSRDLAPLEKESDIFRCDWIVCELCDVMFDLPYIYIYMLYMRAFCILPCRCWVPVKMFFLVPS